MSFADRVSAPSVDEMLKTMEELHQKVAPPLVIHFTEFGIKGEPKVLSGMEDPVTGKVEDVVVVHPDDREHVMAEVAKMAEGLGLFFRVEIRGKDATP